jgi:hypothetical protein
VSPGGNEFLRLDLAVEGSSLELEDRVREALLEEAAHSDVPLFVLENTLPLVASASLLGYPTGPTRWDELPDEAWRYEDLLRSIRERITVVADPVGLSTMSQEVIDKLANGFEATPEEVDELCAEIARIRPALPVADDGTVPAYPGTDGIAAMWPKFAAAVAPALDAVGLVSNVYAAEGAVLHKPRGTAWLAGTDVVATNFHVLEELTDGGWVPGSDVPGSAAMVRFAVRHGFEGPAALCGSVLASDEDLDLALIRVVAGESSLPAPVRLATDAETLLPEGPRGLVGRYVAVLGYPFLDRRNPFVGDAVLKDAGGFQAVAPGVVTEADDRTFRHESTTTGGNSGSPVMDMETCAVVGVHREGTRVFGANIATRVSEVHRLLGSL